MEELNIVELIEKNPITKLSSNYNNKLLNKIKENFTELEQQLFVSSFYCFLKYDKNKDFVIDFDNVWKWLGFNQKYNAKRVLEKNFTIDKDYINFAPHVGGAKNDSSKIKENRGGHNKETIMMNINCFKKYCLKADTKKAYEIHDYYLKMEEILHEIIEEESNELRLQIEQSQQKLEQKQTELDYTIDNSKKDKQKAVEQATIAQFPVNTECIYFGTIDNTNDTNEKLIKFGHTNNLSTRVSYHHNNYENFILVSAFRVQNKVEIENLIKTYPKIKKQIRTIEVNGKNKTEIIAYDATNFTIEKLSKYIKDIIHSKTYSIDNFNKLLQQNEELENENRDLKEQIKNNTNIISNQTLELNECKEIIENQKNKIISINEEEKSVYKNVLLPEDDLTKRFQEFVSKICIVRPDVEELSVNLEGRYRLWSGVKPSKEVFHALKNYLDTQFKPKKIKTQHGYLGIKLKEVEYKKTKENSNVETFIFQICQFSDCGKILNSVLLKEYQKWKQSVNKELSDNDMKEIKEYLNSSPHALKATVWYENESNEGYYGLSLRPDYYETKLILNSSRGKVINKKDAKTHELLGIWESILKASLTENFSPAKMSRCVKNNTIIQDYYYCVAN
jgi:cell division septum initiation protein DivIVA